MTIEARGLTELLRHLEEFGQSLHHLDDPLAQAGVEDQAAARDLVPRLSGDLGATIAYRVTGDSLELRAGDGLEYGGVIHYGWPGHGIEAVPFLVQAVLEKLPDTTEQIDREIEGRLAHYRLK